MYQYGTTPLMSAAWNGYLPMVEYLVEKGADMEAKDNAGDLIDPLFVTLVCSEDGVYCTWPALATSNTTRRWKLLQHC